MEPGQSIATQPMTAFALPFERETARSILPPDSSRQSVHNLLTGMPFLERSAHG